MYAGTMNLSGLANDSGGNTTTVDPGWAEIIKNETLMKALPSGVSTACLDKATDAISRASAGMELSSAETAALEKIKAGDYAGACKLLESTSGNGMPWWGWVLIVAGGTKVLGVW